MPTQILIVFYTTFEIIVLELLILNARVVRYQVFTNALCPNQSILRLNVNHLRLPLLFLQAASKRVFSLSIILFFDLMKHGLVEWEHLNVEIKVT